MFEDFVQNVYKYHYDSLTLWSSQFGLAFMN